MQKLKFLTASLMLASVSALASPISAIMYTAADPFIKNYADTLQSLANADKQDLALSFSQGDLKIENLNIQKAFGAKSAALILNLVEPQRALQVANLAYKNAKTPLIYINRKPSEQALKIYGNSWYVGADASQAGNFQAEILTEYCLKHHSDRNNDGKISYILLEGEALLDDTVMRSMSVRAGFDTSPVSYEEIAAISCNWKADKATYEINQFIEKNGIEKIEAIVANNDTMALGALKALQAVGYNQGDSHKYIPIVGVDGSAEALSAIKAGFMTGTVQNDGKSQAETSYKIAKLILAGKEVNSKNLGRFIDNHNCVYIPYLKISSVK